LVIDNLSYFDTMHMADRITSDKDIVIYPFNGDEGGGVVQTEVKLS
jgi:cephalosporin-C deacetylase